MCLRAFLALAAATLSSQSDSYVFSFYPGKGVKHAPEFIRMQDGPCGPTALARVRYIPIHWWGAPLEPERLFEVSPRGGILGEWPAPVHSLPIGVHAGRLLFEDAGHKYWVKRGGAVSRHKTGDRSAILESEAHHEKCPQVEAFAGSAYVSCRTYRDPGTGIRRTLVFQWRCT